jgi:hypothetical protein
MNEGGFAGSHLELVVIPRLPGKGQPQGVAPTGFCVGGSGRLPFSTVFQDTGCVCSGYCASKVGWAKAHAGSFFERDGVTNHRRMTSMNGIGRSLIGDRRIGDVQQRQMSQHGL